jgi:hypothetical protein
VAVLVGGNEGIAVRVGGSVDVGIIVEVGVNVDEGIVPPSGARATAISPRQ